MTTTQFALRASLDILLFGPHQPFTWTRTIAETCLTIGSSLSVAMLFPNAAEKMFAVTGATAVAIICYVIPIYIHFRVMQQQSASTKGSARKPACGASGASAATTARTTKQDGSSATPLASQHSESPSTRVLGAVSVDMVCERGDDSGDAGPECQQPLLQPPAAAGERAASGSGRRFHGGWIHTVVMPIFVLLLGVGFSVAAIFVAVQQMLYPDGNQPS